MHLTKKILSSPYLLIITYGVQQVPQASKPLVEPSWLVEPHLLGLDPGLPSNSGAVLQCRQSGGQEVDEDEAEDY